MTQIRPLTTIGVISGTSMDGIDVALLRTDGVFFVEPGAGQTFPYPQALRRELQAVLADPTVAERDPLTELDNAVTMAFIQAIADFMRAQDIAPSSVDVIGSHGQTIYHRPEHRFTRQLGIGEKMAKALGVNVVNRFRHADVAAGGQGAPLVPFYHAALAHDLPQPLMVLNLGGVANVTYIDGDTIIAFDTGPASALIDDQMMRHFGKAYDEGGRVAQSGKVDQAILARLMDNPFFAQPAPKSLDRNDFHQRAKIVDALSPQDAVATLAAFTIEATAAALAHVPQRPARWLVAGGGRHNRFFMEGLAKRLGGTVDPVESVGWNGDLLEAQCFGYLAVRSLRGLPLSLPSTTGAPAPMTGGEFWRAA